jgi:hypothetical protein
MDKTESILLRRIVCGTIAIETSTADLNAIYGSKIRGREGVDFIVGVATEEEIVFVELIVDPRVVGIVILRLIRADDEVVGDCYWWVPEITSLIA